MLRLEITETVLIAEGSRVRRVIDALGDLGVLVSLDDFGTGYSPLSYLRELPVTEIKIDRSFIASMMSDRDTATIVSAVIGLARRLGIDVVAEGIETAGQLEMLRSFDCPFAQGYLFSRPLPAQVVARWLKEDALQHIAEEVLAAGRLADLGVDELELDAPTSAASPHAAGRRAGLAGTRRQRRRSDPLAQDRAARTRVGQAGRAAWALASRGHGVGRARRGFAPRRFLPGGAGGSASASRSFIALPMPSVSTSMSGAPS